MLALDTSTSRTDVALVVGDQVLAHLHADGAMAHGEALGALVEQAFRDSRTTAADLTSVAVGTGPGPFTGLRVGLAFARTMALARNIPAHGICSLDVIAAAVHFDEEFLVATDARRKEIYWARYRGAERVDGPHVTRPADVAEFWADRPIIGDGARTYGSLFAHASEPWLPSAVVLAHEVRRRHAVGEVLPLDAQYLRAPDVSI